VRSLRTPFLLKQRVGVTGRVILVLVVVVILSTKSSIDAAAAAATASMATTFFLPHSRWRCWLKQIVAAAAAPQASSKAVAEPWGIPTFVDTLDNIVIVVIPDYHSR
jgi:hypothetical protein